MDENDSRIPVLFSLTSSCAASFAAFRGKVLEACGLSLKYVICIKISKSNCVKLLDGQYAYDSTDLSLILTTADDKVVELMLKGVSHKALAQLDKHSDEQSLQRIREPVTTACGQIDKMVRTDVPELWRPWFAEGHSDISSPLCLAISKAGVVYFTDDS